MKLKNTLVIVGIVVVACIIAYLLFTNVYLKMPHPANVSRDKDYSYEPIMLLDSDDNPHIIWESDDADGDLWDSEIYYTKWNGENWVNDKGEIVDKYRINLNISENSFDSGLGYFFLDSKNYPHVLWFDSRVLGGGHTVYRKWDENGWVDIKGSTESTYYSDFDNPIGTSDVVMDSDDNLHVITHVSVPRGDTFDYRIGYLKRIDGKWINIFGDEYSKDNDFLGIVIPSIVDLKIQVDSSGYPCILWTDDDYDTDGFIYFIRWNGEDWVNVAGESCNIGFENSRIYDKLVDIFRVDFMLDSDDNPHIFMNYFSEKIEEYDYCLLIYYVKWDGKKWINEKGTIKNSFDEKNWSLKMGYSDSLVFSFDLDSKNQPHICFSSWVENIGTNIYYAHLDGDTWKTASGEFFDKDMKSGSLSQNYYSSWQPSLAIDSDDFPHICWRDNLRWETYDEIMYVKWNGESWVCADGTPYKPSRYKGE